MNYSAPDLRDRLAAEFVLGTLHGRARSRMQHLLRDDAPLRARVAFWERKLTPLASHLSAVAPPARVWHAIVARIGPRQRVVPARQGWLPSWLAPWFTRWFAPWLDARALGSLATGLFMGVAIALTVPKLLDRASGDAAETQLPQSYVGVLATTDGRTGLIVSSRRHGSVMDVKQVKAVPVPSGQTFFLWAIDRDGTTWPIGPVPQGSFVQVSLAQPSDKLFATATELAVSIEAAGSAPAQPGSAFVYRGLCGKLWRVPARK